MKAKICEKCGYLVFDELAHDRICEESMLRARVAELEKQVESMREESIDIAESLIFAVNKKDISNIERQNIFDKAKMFIEHWQPRGNDEGGEL